MGAFCMVYDLILSYSQHIYIYICVLMFVSRYSARAYLYLMHDLLFACPS